MNKVIIFTHLIVIGECVWTCYWCSFANENTHLWTGTQKLNQTELVPWNCEVGIKY